MAVIYNVLKEEKARAMHKIELFQRHIEQMPKGKIIEKRIHGKLYKYLVFRDGKKVRSKYVKDDDVEKISEQLQKRAELKKMVQGMKEDLKILTKIIKD